MKLAVNRRQLRIASPSAPALPLLLTTEEVKSRTEQIRVRSSIVIAAMEVARQRRQQKLELFRTIKQMRAAGQARHDYVAGWEEWMETHSSLAKKGLAEGDLSRISLAVLRTHESKLAPGGLIASLSIPWGFSKGDDDLGGYHLVWSRDMVETAGGLLAAGAHEDVRRVLSYLQTTQLADGHCPTKHVAGRLALLERNPDGRDGSAHLAGGFCATGKGVDRR